MEPDDYDQKPITPCDIHIAEKKPVVAKGHWRKVIVVGDGEKARVGPYEVGVAGNGGCVTGSTKHLHGIVAITSDGGCAESGGGGVSVSSGGGLSVVGDAGYAYGANGKAIAGRCGVAGSTGGHAIAAKNGIGVGWFGYTKGAKVEAGEGGLAIGGTHCFLKVGPGGALVAMALPRDAPAKTPATKICRVGECGIKADTWYLVAENLKENGDVDFEFREQKPPVA